MGSVWMVASSDLRRHARSFVGLVALTAFVSTVVLTALVGAQRTATALDRFRAESRARDVRIQVDDPEVSRELGSALAALPAVEAAGLWTIAPALPQDAPEGTADFAIVGDPGGHYGVDIDRPRMMSGRSPYPSAADETVLSETAADLLGLGVGDRFAASTFSPEDLMALVQPETEFPGFNGAPVDLEVVGIGRWPEELQGRVQSAVLMAWVSPAFLAAHETDIGAWPATSVLRLARGETDLAEVQRTAQQIAGPDIELIVEPASIGYVDSVQAAIDALASATLAFGIVAGLAGLVVVAQAISRRISSVSASRSAFRALGVSRRGRAAGVLLPLGATVFVGVALGVALSVALSPILPLGLAREAEPDPGVWVDAPVLAAGAAALLVLLLLWVTIATVRATSRRAMVARVARRSNAASLVARSGASPMASSGVRFAFEAGSGRTSVPVRSAIAGGAIGVAGVVAAAVLATSLSTLLAHPDRWGWTWSSRPDIYGEVDPALAALEADDRVTDVAGLSYAAVEVDGEQITGYAMERGKGDIPFTIVEGRVPTSPDEVAMGQRTLSDLGLALGDRADFVAADREGVRSSLIVGAVAAPMVESTDPGRGAVFTVEGLDAVRQSDGSRQLLLTYAPGVEVAGLEDDLVESASLGFPVYARADPPGEVGNLEQVRSVIGGLAAFFAVLGCAGIAHALALSVRRRRPDLAVLRVLGFDRSNVRRTIRWQASVIASTAAVIGIPLGIIVGRVLWHGLVGDMGIIDSPTQPWLVIALAVPVTVVVAIVVAWPPARWAVRDEPAVGLRVE